MNTINKTEAKRVRVHIKDCGNTVYLRESYMSNETRPEPREFMVQSSGGYVREFQPGAGSYSGTWSQVCDGLGLVGSTLTCYKEEYLIDVIRREYRAM